MKSGLTRWLLTVEMDAVAENGRIERILGVVVGALCCGLSAAHARADQGGSAGISGNKRREEYPPPIARTPMVPPLRRLIIAAFLILLQLTGHALGQGSFCSNGIPGIEESGICCVEGCGQCGGPGCSSIEGYSGDECCTSDITYNNELCTDKEEAPCVIEADEGDITTPPSMAAPTPQPINASTTQPVEAPTSQNVEVPVPEPVTSRTTQPTAAGTMPIAESSTSISAVPWSLQDTEAWMIYLGVSITIANFANLWFHTRYRYRRGRGHALEDMASRSSFQSKVEIHRYLMLAAFVLEVGQGIAITFLADNSLGRQLQATMYVLFGFVVTGSSFLLRRAGRNWHAVLVNAVLEGLFVAVILSCFVEPLKGSTVLLVLLAANEAAIGLAIHLQVGCHLTTSAATRWATCVLGGGEAEPSPPLDFDVYNRQTSADLCQEFLLMAMEVTGNVLLPVGLIFLQPLFYSRSPWRSDFVMAWWVACTLLVFTVSLTHLLPPGRYSAYGQGGATFVSATLNSTFVVAAFACLVMALVTLLKGDYFPLFDFVWSSGVTLGCILGAYASHRWNMRTFWNQVSN